MENAGGRRRRARLGEGVAGVVGLRRRARDDGGLATGGVVALNEGGLEGRRLEAEESSGSLRRRAGRADSCQMRRAGGSVGRGAGAGEHRVCLGRAGAAPPARACWPRRSRRRRSRACAAPGP